jgi:hypothetical protein
MIKKLRNQPYAPKVGTSSKVGARGKKIKMALFHSEFYECGVKSKDK